MRWAALLLVTLALACAAPAQLARNGDEAAVRALIDRWYAAHRAGAEGRPALLHAPGAIDASPGFRHVDTGAANLGPRAYTSLASQALVFEHEITRLDLDTRFARVGVRERGFFYAWAVERTTESMGSATFVLEKQADGRWLVLAHETNRIGIPPNLRTDPLPDLRALYEATQSAGAAD